MVIFKIGSSFLVLFSSFPKFPRVVLRRRPDGGFTPVEISVVILVIGPLSLIRIPRVRRAIMTTRSKTVANDLRVFSIAFQQYRAENTDFPSDSATGAMPIGMAEFLRETTWLATTPISGRYNWDFNCNQAGTVYRAAIGLRSVGANSVSSDLEQLLQIDRLIHDGSLVSGNFF
jgi:type II secretory pathway pseudopilin PulG